MNQNICVITGCNSGIGKVTAIELAKLGYEIVMLVRDSEKSRIAFMEIKQASESGAIRMMFVDLSSLDSIRQVAGEILGKYSKIDLLINNAGLFKRNYEKSIDGFELTMAVNYFAPFALTNLLLPLIKKGDKARIINLSSELYKRGQIHLDNQFSEDKFNGNKVYANSKLLVNYFTKELARRLEGTELTVNCVHPGVVGTDVFREYPLWFAKLMNLFILKPEDGAKPSIYLATSNELEKVSGSYFYKTQVKEMVEIANDMDLAKQIWEKTEEMIGAWIR